LEGGFCLKISKIIWKNHRGDRLSPGALYRKPGFGQLIISGSLYRKPGSINR
jgi:hypothetical protein